MSEIKTIDEVLAFAIREEEKAAALYTEMADQTAQPALRQAFMEMAAEEERHKRRLEEVQAGGSLAPSPARIADLGLAEMLTDPDLGDDKSYEDMLIFAMKREKEAFLMYSRLAMAAEDERIREVFMALAQEEAKHKLHIETMYDDGVYLEN